MQIANCIVLDANFGHIMEGDLNVKYLTSIVLSENESKLRKKRWGIALRTVVFEEHQQIKQRILAVGNEGPKGHTALLDSIDQALSLSGTAQAGDATYLVGDGGENKFL